MLRNYLVVAWRNLLRNRIYAGINVLGLGIGLAFCVLTFLFIGHEWSYDSCHENADKIYRLYGKKKESEGERIGVRTPMPLAPALLESYPEISHAVRARRNWRPVVIQSGDKRFKEEGLVFADPEVFEVFSFPVVAGDLQRALDGKNKVVLTREMAQKYFGSDDPLGELLTIVDFDEDFTVSGVVEVPTNSTFCFDLLLSSQHFLDSHMATMWNSSSVITYVMLAEGTQSAQLETRFPAFVDAHFGDYDDVELHLQPLKEMHLDPMFQAGLTPASDPLYSYILAGISLAVLLIACVNFTNLSLGMASSRFREVGMRKILGSTQWQLVKQFCGEAVLLSLFALVIGVALAEVALPAFNGMVDRDLVLGFDRTWVFLIGLVLVVGVVAGAYPALMLSRPQSVEMLKGRLRLSGGNWFSRGLIVAQFTLSVGLVVMTLLMAEQMEFMRTKNLGFDEEQVVVIPMGSGVGADEKRRLLEVYRNAVAQQGEILNAAAADASFSGSWGSFNRNKHEGKPFEFFVTRTDGRLLETLDMELVAGRSFIPGSQVDRQESAIVNEALVEDLGWEEPLGKTVPTWRRTIIGVVRNYHMESLHHQIKPVVLEYWPDENRGLRYLFVKISSEDISGCLALVRELWEQVVPHHPFEYSFLDEDVDRQYRVEERWGWIVRYSTLFAIFVACLGALGLTSLAVARRTKEIGVRKVLGASASSIVALLSRDFVKLVVVANLIAWPLVYYAMREWLQDFAYRIDIGPGTFVWGGILTLMVVLLTVSLQAVKAALSNPVEALRYE